MTPAFKLEDIQKELLKEVVNLGCLTDCAFNIRANGESVGRNSTENIQIEPHPKFSGLKISVKAGTVGETVYIPVIISQSGLKETVHNDIYIGENCRDISVVAGCGIDNCGRETSQHDGVHRIFVGKDSSAQYIEKHFARGKGSGERILNPQTEVFLGENSELVFKSYQVEGVNSAKRKTVARIGEGAKLLVQERVLTHDEQFCESSYEVFLSDGGVAQIISHAVARQNSKQKFFSTITGDGECIGHVECDAILMDSATVSSTPSLVALSPKAQLTHEAAIGKISGEQILKLMTLGLKKIDAERVILEGFLK